MTDERKPREERERPQKRRMVRQQRPRRLPAPLRPEGPGMAGRNLRWKARGWHRQLLERGYTLQRHLRELAAHVKRGVLAAGGFPLEFPTISLGEFFLSPTSMYCRNLMSMDVEEMIRGLPIDSVVLLSGCDKTTPAMLMGAASAICQP